VHLIALVLDVIGAQDVAEAWTDITQAPAQTEATSNPRHRAGDLTVNNILQRLCAEITLLISTHSPLSLQ
jgi:hypothetical protein